MNFPGLDPIYTAAHYAAHATRLVQTCSLEEIRTGMDEGEKVLVVATTALGDSILTTPLIETLSAKLGRDRVSMLVRTPYVDLFQDDPRVHAVFSVRGKYRWGSLKEKLAADPHRIALLSNITEPDLVPFLWRSGVRGFLRYRTRWTRYPGWMANEEMLRKPKSPDYATGHAIENNLAMAEALGIKPTTHQLKLPHLMTSADGQERGLLIHPGASREIKRWPVENWAQLADALWERFKCPIALTGDRSEHSLAARVAAAMKRKPFIMAGKLSLPALARIQSQALAFLSGDTGPYHMAVAVDCPTVTLFAPTDRGSSKEACGPHEAPAKYHRAIETAHPGDSIATISVAQVLAQAIQVIEASQHRPAQPKT